MSSVSFKKDSKFTKTPTTATAVTPAAEPMPEIPGVESVTGAGPAPSQVPAAYSPPPVPAPYQPEVPQRQFSDTSLDEASFELRLPALNIVQGVGPLSETFIPGAIVIDRTLEILPSPKGRKPTDPKVSLNLTIVGARPVTFVEKQATYDPGTPTLRCNSEREVAELGGTLDYATHKRDGKPLFERMVTLLGLVEKPAHVEDLTKFPIGITLSDGKTVGAFAPILIHLRGVQYNNGFVPLSTARRSGYGIQLRNGYYTRVIRARTEVKPFQNGKSAYIWVFEDGGPSDKEVVAEAYALIGQPSPYGNVAQSQRAD